MAPKISRVEKKKLKEKVTVAVSLEHASMSNAVLIAEITEVISKLMDEKLKKINDSLTTMVAQNAERLASAEERISTAENSVKSLQTKVTEMETQLETVNEKLMDLENRSRRDNLKILYLKEGIEGTDSKKILESMLPKLLGLETDKGIVKIDRAHRVGPKTDERPRVMILKLHNSSDKDRIMRAVKATKSLTLEGKKLAIYQDIHPAIREQRRGFNEICEELIKKKIRFSMQFPATLCLTHGEERRAFRSPAEARIYLDTL